MQRKYKKNSGYTIPTVILLMLLLFAFAIGLLMFASYNYNNAYKRHEKMQTYLYAKNLLDECEYFIMEGEMNEYLAGVMKDVNHKLLSESGENANLYGEKYSFKLELSDRDLLINPYTNDEVDIEMYITYKPILSNIKLPEKENQYVSVGDWMDIEFRIRKIKGNSRDEMEYQFLSEFYCSYDASRNSDGTIINDPAIVLDSYSNLKWKPFQHTGKIYSK